MKTQINFFVISLVVSLVFAADAWPVQAGRVQFVNGEVQVTDAAGRTQAVQKGDAINEGDTLTSAKAASAQIKMQDGGFVAVRPDTQLKFDSFKFSGKEGEPENSFFSLFKGGFRAVTGLIGRVRKQDYHITTPAATIGIRGTDHETVMVLPDNPLVLAGGAAPGAYNKVNVGETYMTTDKGTIFVLPNQMGFAGGLNQMPQIQPINANLFTVAPQPSPGANMDSGKGENKGARDTAVVDPTNGAPTGGNNVADGGAGNGTTLPNVAPPTVVVTPPVLPNLLGGNGVFPAQSSTLGVMIQNTNPNTGGQETWYASSRLLPVNFDANGILTIVNWCMGCGTPDVARITAASFDAGADSGVVAWGRWSNGSTTFGGWGPITLGADQGFSFVVGTLTPQLPVTGAYTFNLIGATAPVNNIVAGLTTGPVTASGSLGVNFGATLNNLQLLMNIASGNAAFQIAGMGSTGSGPTAAEFSMSGTMTRTGGAAPFCTTACPTGMVGAFFGTGATHAGIAYRADAALSGGGVIDGVAVFKR